MKQYSKIYSFGCSFTEGGGLNNQNFHRYLSGDTNYSSVPESVLSKHSEYANYHSYSGYLSRLLNCDLENHGTSRAGNELIFNMAYDTVSNLENTSDILVTIQTSLLSRILLQTPYKDNKVTSVNNFSNIEGSIKQYYELYICEFFDHQYACKKLLQEIDTYTAWFKKKKIDVLWIIYEIDLNKIPNEEHIAYFDGLDLLSFIKNNKLTITDLPNFPYSDPHISPEGNQIVANKLYQHLKKYYD